MTNSSITWRQRALAVSTYLGLLPFILFLPKLRAAPYVRHHFRQAAALYAICGVLTVVFVVLALILSYLLVFHRALYVDYQLERYMMGILRKLYLAWIVFWVFGMGLALAGSSHPMPLIRRIADQRLVWRGACLSLLFAYATIAALIPIVFHANALAPSSRTEGKIHFLYEDNETLPRWLFLIGFYPMTQTASKLWGKESVVIQRFNRATVTTAVSEATAIYLGTHGTSRGLMLKNDWLTPADLASMPINPDLKFVYLSGCDGGQQRDGWLEAFAPAEVITFDRLSAVLEHIWWLWIRGPEKLRTLYGENDQ